MRAYNARSHATGGNKQPSGGKMRQRVDNKTRYGRESPLSLAELRSNYEYSTDTREAEEPATQGWNFNAASSRRAQIASFVVVAASLAVDTAAANDSSEKLPSDFISLERNLISAVKASIAAELEGSSESEVRKSAENAKGPIREFISKWKLDKRVQGSDIFQETSLALEELGQYYLKRGQRAALDSRTASSILRHLDAASASLPPEQEKKIFGLF